MPGFFVSTSPTVACLNNPYNASLSSLLALSGTFALASCKGRSLWSDASNCAAHGSQMLSPIHRQVLCQRDALLTYLGGLVKLLLQKKYSSAQVCMSWYIYCKFCTDNCLCMNGTHSKQTCKERPAQAQQNNAIDNISQAAQGQVRTWSAIVGACTVYIASGLSISYRFQPCTQPKSPWALTARQGTLALPNVQWRKSICLTI